MKKLMSVLMVLVMTITLIPILGGGIDTVSYATDGGGATLEIAPVAPTQLALPSGYIISGTSVKLIWKDNSTNEEGFKIERVAKGGAAWTQVATVGANVTNFTDSGLKPGTTYYYHVKAYNWVGSSKSSNDLIITTGTSGTTTPPVVAPTYSKTPSAWAAAEIELAKTAGLTVDTLLTDYNKPITRAEFASLVVKLYEKATGTVVVPVTPNPFTDTTDVAVLKAYTAGIINGVSADKFAPNANVTRQEMAVMLQRELKAADPEGGYFASPDFDTVFADESKIASWAIEAVRFMNESGIVNGVGENKIDPLGNATREQAMLMNYRNFAKFVL